MNALVQTEFAAIVAGRNRPQKHVDRTRVVLASAQGDPVQRVAARLGVNLPSLAA